jgi:hypothetical protein
MAQKKKDPYCWWLRTGGCAHLVLVVRDEQCVLAGADTAEDVSAAVQRVGRRGAVAGGAALAVGAGRPGRMVAPRVQRQLA